MPVAANLDTDIGWALGVIFRAYVKATTSVTADIPGGHRGFQVLTRAASNPLASQRAIAQQLGIDRTVMTYLLDDMEKAKLVQRRADPADRRTRHVVATEYGLSVLADTCERLNLVESHILGKLSNDDRQALMAILPALAHQLNELDPITDLCEVVQDIGAGPQPRPD